MFITETELEENPDKYLAMAAEEDIFITKSGKTIAKLTSSNLERIQSIEELFGSIPADITLEEAREERLSKL